MVPRNNLGPNLAGKLVNETLYREMIRSLMYLTATRPDIQFLTCLCARYQASLKESHLIAMKRIFMYLKGTPSLSLWEFWCTTIAYDPNPPSDDFEARPLKEYKIKFTVMNGKKPLTLNYKTFIKTIGLDYIKGTYVSHPSPEAMKAKLAKIATKEVMVNRTPVLKIAFPVAWRILFTFEIHDSSKVTNIELTPSMVVVNNLETSVSLLLFSGKKKKRKSQTVFQPKPKTQGPKASGLLPQKRKKALTKKSTPSATETPPIEKGSYSPLDEGTCKSQPLPKCKTTDPKDSKGNDQPADKGLPSTVLNEGIDARYQVDQNQSTRFEVSVPDQHQSKTFSEKEQDFEPLKLTTIADIQALLGATEDELNEDSNDDVFGNGYSLKDKNQAKTDKTEHGIGKS
ncbi:hypothetical protein Tco_0644093, partial [Tanacetum coccineum]